MISANIAGRDLKSIVNQIKEKIYDTIQLPENYYIQYGRQFESEAKASKILFFTSLISLFIIFLLLYQEFKNIKLAGIVFLNLPLDADRWCLKHLVYRRNHKYSFDHWIYFTVWNSNT
ncbi:MAG: efflux RND transporter permease subunit [Candidatus Jettenia sp. CY-1]|nr:MAG: efflux RND transporter permease subunit [Candidatus Jettenia sp. CY-1]